MIGLEFMQGYQTVDGTCLPGLAMMRLRRQHELCLRRLRPKTT